MVRIDGKTRLVGLQLNLRAGGGASFDWNRVQDAEVPITVRLRGAWSVRELVSGRDLRRSHPIPLTLAADRPAILALTR